MKKFTKQLLTGLVALGLLVPVATSSLNPIKTTVNARRYSRKYHKKFREKKSRKRTYSPMPKFLYGNWRNRYNGKISFNESGANIRPNHHGRFYDAASWNSYSYGNNYYVRLLMDYKHNLSYGPMRTWKIRRINNHKIYIYRQDGKHTSTGVYYK